MPSSLTTAVSHCNARSRGHESDAQMVSQFALDIAEIVIEISSDRPLDSALLERQYAHFLTTKAGTVHLQAHYGMDPDFSIAEARLIFDSGAVWRLYHLDGQSIITLRDSGPDEKPYLTAVFTPDFSQGALFLNHPGLNDSVPFVRGPLLHPLPEILTVCLLAQGRGVMIHACGIDDHGSGYLFSGHSGNGKSTLGKLWVQSGQGKILNDDRIILRERDGQIWMYSTPWHGTYPEFTAASLPLKQVFFLHHSPQNSVKSAKGRLAAAGLMARSFPTAWDADGMTFTLDFLTRVAEQIPCHDLYFVPDTRVIEKIRYAI